MSFNTPPPASLLARLGYEHSSDLLCACSDQGPDGHFQDCWLILGPDRVASGNGDFTFADLALADIKEVVVDELHGRARLLAKCEDADHCLIHYTADMINEFAAVSRAINEALRGRDAVLPDQIEAIRDPETGMPLRERGGISPDARHRRSTVFRIIALLSPHKRKVAGLICLTFISVGAQMVAPICYKEITDSVIEGGQHEQLLLWIGIMIVCHLLVGGSRWLANSVNAWLSTRLVGDLRSSVHRKLQELQMSYHNRHESGELIGRVSHDTNTLLGFLVDGFPWLLVNVVSLIVIAVILLTLQPLLALFVFIPVPLIIIGGRWFYNRLNVLGHRIGNRYAQMHSQLGESIRGVKAVKAAGQEDRRSKEFDEVNGDLIRTSFVAESNWVGFFEAASLGMAVGTVCIWYVGTSMVIAPDSTTSLGTLIAFVGYLVLFYGPLQWFTFVLNWIGRATAGAERIFHVLDQDTERDHSDGDEPLPQVQGDIRLNELRFSYERGKEVLKGIDLHFPAGTMTGLVGKSGSGKSTIINLICRFFSPDSGTVTVDGKDLQGVRLQDWRQHIGIVMQDPFLFNASITDNIRYGRPDASFTDVVRAARAAHAHTFIVGKEDGYDSIVGEGGITLSGGEKQRIAIARAILADPQVLILDEATSAVDSETEKAIQSAIDNLVEGRTTIAIAHRLATLRNADRLVVIDDGKVAETGTHAELLANPEGTFSRLVRMQQEINELRSSQQAYSED